MDKYNYRLQTGPCQTCPEEKWINNTDKLECAETCEAWKEWSRQPHCWICGHFLLGLGCCVDEDDNNVNHITDPEFSYDGICDKWCEFGTSGTVTDFPEVKCFKSTEESQREFYTYTFANGETMVYEGRIGNPNVLAEPTFEEAMAKIKDRFGEVKQVEMESKIS